MSELKRGCNELEFERSSKPKPVAEGKEYVVEVTETSRRGEGIARIEGFVVFVPSTKPGDKVTVKVTRVADRFATGEVVQ